MVIEKSWHPYKDTLHNIRESLDALRTEEAETRRKAIHTVNKIYQAFGIIRENFYKVDNDRLAQNAIYALCEKAVQDYFAALEWEVIDKKKLPVDGMIRRLNRPNYQETFSSLIKKTVRDLIRYDAAVIVLTKSVGGDILEMKAFHGPEFWVEMDRPLTEITGPQGQTYAGYWSHGYVKRYWQHAQPGWYVPMEPDEVVYLQMYPQSDSPYGTDFISRLRWQLEYLLDSTKAAGMTFQNGVMPGIVWEHPEICNREQLAERIQQIELENQGPDNFGGILHLMKDEKITPLSATFHEMEWLEGQKWVSQIVWAMFGFSENEFSSGDVTRATAYISQNLTKSRMLYPLMKLYEETINAQILPYLPGYEEGMKFKFSESVNLDDDLKIAQIDFQKAQVAQTLLQMGVPPKIAFKIAKIGDDVTTPLLEELEWDTGQMDDVQAPPQEGGVPDAYTESYSGTSQSQEYQEPVSKGRKSGDKNQRLDIFLHVEN
jgi:phage portal protein BeeE